TAVKRRHHSPSSDRGKLQLLRGTLCLHPALLCASENLLSQLKFCSLQSPMHYLSCEKSGLGLGARGALLDGAAALLEGDAEHVVDEVARDRDAEQHAPQAERM